LDFDRTDLEQLTFQEGHLAEVVPYYSWPFFKLDNSDSRSSLLKALWNKISLVMIVLLAYLDLLYLENRQEEKN